LISTRSPSWKERDQQIAIQQQEPPMHKGETQAESAAELAAVQEFLAAHAEPGGASRQPAGVGQQLEQGEQRAA
jgi:hypothetical protein